MTIVLTIIFLFLALHISTHTYVIFSWYPSYCCYLHYITLLTMHSSRSSTITITLLPYLSISHKVSLVSAYLIALTITFFIPYSTYTFKVFLVSAYQPPTGRRVDGLLRRLPTSLCCSKMQGVTTYTSVQGAYLINRRLP